MKLIKEFKDFLNEGRQKFPEHKVGDLLLTREYHEFQTRNSIEGNSWETYYKYVASRWNGALLKIVKVDIDKKEYVTEFIGGILSRLRRGSSIGESVGVSKAPVYLRVKHSDKLSQEDANEAFKYLEKSEIQPDETVSIKAKDDKYYTRKVIGIDFLKTLENKKLYYVIKDVENSISVNSIEKEIDLKDDFVIDLLAKEIARVTDTEIRNFQYSAFNFEAPMLDASNMLEGRIFFRSDEERDKFCEDLQKFIDKYLDKKLQAVMHNGDFSTLKVRPGKTQGNGSITQSKIVQAARNAGINIKEFLEKKKGVITGKKYGL